MKPPPGAPWAPTEYELSDVGAIQAMAKGEARSDQQQQALRFIVEQICKVYDLSYRPDSERDTAFAEGKRFVGTQIVKFTKLNVALLRKTDGRRDTSAHRDAERDTSAEQRAAQPAAGAQPKRRGRPPGSKNKPKPAQGAAA